MVVAINVGTKSTMIFEYNLVHAEGSGAMEQFLSRMEH